MSNLLLKIVYLNRCQSVGAVKRFFRPSLQLLYHNYLILSPQFLHR